MISDSNLFSQAGENWLECSKLYSFDFESALLKEDLYLYFINDPVNFALELRYRTGLVLVLEEKLFDVLMRDTKGLSWQHIFSLFTISNDMVNGFKRNMMVSFCFSEIQNLKLEDLQLLMGEIHSNASIKIGIRNSFPDAFDANNYRPALLLFFLSMVDNPELILFKPGYLNSLCSFFSNPTSIGTANIFKPFIRRLSNFRRNI